MTGASESKAVSAIHAKCASTKSVMGWRRNWPERRPMFFKKYSSPMPSKATMSGSVGKSVPKPPGSSTSVENGTQAMSSKKSFRKSTNASQPSSPATGSPSQKSSPVAPASAPATTT